MLHSGWTPQLHRHRNSQNFDMFLPCFSSSYLKGHTSRKRWSHKSELSSVSLRNIQIMTQTAMGIQHLVVIHSSEHFSIDNEQSYTLPFLIHKVVKVCARTVWRAYKPWCIEKFAMKANGASMSSFYSVKPCPWFVTKSMMCMLKILSCEDTGFQSGCITVLYVPPGWPRVF